MGQIPQVEHTYQYFTQILVYQRNGSVMGGVHCRVRRELREARGWIDCWTAQDIAREGLHGKRSGQNHGDLVEQYGWYGSGEIMNVTDGDEVWIAEFYGRDLWLQ